MIINATPHPIAFQDEDGNLIIVPMSGKTLKADAIETVVRTAHGKTFVKSVFVPSKEGTKELEALEREFPEAIIVGSIISAQAFPGRVVGMIPTAETVRAAPAEKRFRMDRFTTFE